MIYRNYLKRLLDIVVSAIALILLSPLLVALAILVRTKLGSPIFFSQSRPGYRERIFTLYKFRTMTSQRDQEGNLLPDHIRLTKFGRFLRASSLDELPELWNILLGQMSLVGPRPLLVEYLPLYNAFQKRRHDVRPGLTGLAQVSGRNAIAWEEKFALDVKYIDEMSFWKDVKILLMTVQKVFKREGISSGTSVTMEPFRGSCSERESI